MSRVRLRRLTADAQRIAQAFESSPHIRIVKASGEPPDRYQIEFRVVGLSLQGERVVKRKRHLAEVYLTSGYPRQAPQCRMLTPCFHPNIDPKAICVGDHWAAGESLANLILRIAEIISFQSYNTKSPLNGEAARWVDEHRDLLPIDASDLVPAGLAEIEAASIHVAAPSPTVQRARAVTPTPVVKAAPVSKARILKAKSVQPEAPKVLRAKPIAASGGVRTEMSCDCGRRYRPRKAARFRCLGCGAILDPRV